MQSSTVAMTHCSHSQDNRKLCPTCLYLARNKQRWLVFLQELDSTSKRIDERAKLKEVR